MSKNIIVARWNGKSVWEQNSNVLNCTAPVDPAGSANGVLPPRRGNHGREERPEHGGQAVDHRERVGVGYGLGQHRGRLRIFDGRI